MPEKALTADTKPKKAKQHRNVAKMSRAAYYASLPMITLANKKRTHARQLRRFPEDTQAVKLFVERYGEAAAQTQIANAHLKSGKRAKARKAKVKRDWRERRLLVPVMPVPDAPAYVPDLTEGLG